MTATDLDLNTLATVGAASEEDQVYKVFEFSRAQCSFLPPSSDEPTGLILVVIVKRTDLTFVRILSVEHTGVKQLGIAEIPAETVCQHSVSSATHSPLVYRKSQTSRAVILVI